MKKHRYGLIGRNISYSFSKGYFAKKFERLQLGHCSYENFDLKRIDELKILLKQNPDLMGLNVTIPYKEKILPFLDKIDSKASQIGAVNTIRIKDNKLQGYNTDAIGFRKSLEPHLKPYHKRALILGTGGASKAIASVLEELGMSYKFVSRNPDGEQFAYQDLNKVIVEEQTVIVNCTPLGTHPKVEECPDIPYRFLGKKHLLYDLIYNPEKTTFLCKGEARGASIVNGQKMLELQAEASWEIWNS